MNHITEITNIIVGIFLILIGILIKHGKMYFLIAGYNTMPKEKKQYFDIERFSTLFRNCFLLMGAVILIGQYVLFRIGWVHGPAWIIPISVGSIIPYLLIKGRRYDRSNKVNSDHDHS